jgi:hypothetical protein
MPRHPDWVMTTSRQPDGIAPMLRLGLLAFASVLLLTSCGGSSTSGSTTTTATTAATGGGARLTASQWTTYETAVASAQTVNQKAIKTFTACRRLIDSQASAEKVKSCLGDSTDQVVTEGKALMATLATLAGTTGGACETANAHLTGNIKLYVASVQTLGNAVDQGTIPGASTAINSALTALTRSRAAGAAFEQACKPAAA